MYSQWKQLWSRSCLGLFSRDLGHGIYDRVWSWSRTDHTGQHGHSWHHFWPHRQGDWEGEERWEGRDWTKTWGNSGPGLLCHHLPSWQTMCVNGGSIWGSSPHCQHPPSGEEERVCLGTSFSTEPLFVDHCFVQRNVTSLSNLWKVRLHREVIWILSQSFY